MIKTLFWATGTVLKQEFWLGDCKAWWKNFTEVTKAMQIFTAKYQIKNEDKIKIPIQETS